MFTSIKKVYALLNRKERRRVKILFVLMLLSAFSQVVGVASVVPFIALASNPETALQNEKLRFVYDLFHLESSIELLVLLGVFVIVAVLLSNLALTITLWATSKVSLAIRRDLAVRLLTQYVDRPYEYYLNVNVSVLIKNTVVEVSRLVMAFLLPLLQGITLSITVVFILLALVLADPIAAVSAIFFLGGAYVVFYLGIRKKLENNGVQLSQLNAQKYKLVNELFGGVKELKIFGRANGFIDRFRLLERKSASLDVFQAIAGQLPKYILETLLFGGMVAFIVTLISNGSSLDKILPLLTLYAFAGYRLLPSMQQAFYHFTRVRYAIPALDIVHESLSESQHQQENSIEPSDETLRIQSRLTCDNIVYSYPGTNAPALKGVSFDIKANSTIGLVGSSGSGKSTFVDILLGLLLPEEGEIRVDETALTTENLRSYQNGIGYVPQTIFLADASIRENIAFGIPEEHIDDEMVEKAAKAAMLDKFVASDLPEKYETVVGDKGVRLSGGQRQRIGIARALYGDPSILVLDEATNALDNLTEAEVMQGIYEMAGTKTIIMIAHRLSTVENCDLVFYMDRGEVVDYGKYSELLEKNSRFKNFVNVKKEIS